MDAEQPTPVEAPASEGAATAAGDAEAQEAEDRERRLLSLRERTPELELLLSGAVLFALFQASTAVDEAFFRLVVNVGGALQGAAIVVFEYVKLILYTLIVAFVGHLAARAWWIALIGIDAGFPRGPQWEKLSYGPATIEAYREALPPIRRRIAAADTFSTIVFATGLSFALLFALSIAASAALGGLAWVLARVVPGLTMGKSFLVVSGVVAGGLVLVGIVDKVAGARLLRSRRAPLLRRAARVAARGSGALLFGSISFAVASHLPKKRVYAASIGGLVLIVGLFFVRDILVGFGLLSLHSHRYLPEQPGAAGFDPQYYEAYREPVGFQWLLPSLPAEVVIGPYARLFVPFTPERTDRAVAERCPQLPPVRDAGFGVDARAGRQSAEQASAAAALRDCLSGVVTVELDGEPVPGSALQLAVHPRSGARGLMAWLPMAGVRPGPHRLVVRDHKLAKDEREPRVHHLPFWR
jgi:hypothetical protein